MQILLDVSHVSKDLKSCIHHDIVVQPMLLSVLLDP